MLKSVIMSNFMASFICYVTASQIHASFDFLRHFFLFLSLCKIFALLSLFSDSESFKDGNFSQSVLHFTPTWQNNGDPLICQAINSRLTNGTVQESLILDIRCTYHWIWFICVAANDFPSFLPFTYGQFIFDIRFY